MIDRYRVCFVGRVHYSCPLDTSSEKKFRQLQELTDACVIGFSTDWKPHVFIRHARFYLVPCLPSYFLRNLLMFLVAPVLALWSVLRHDARILVLSSPHEASTAFVKGVARLLGRPVALVVESYCDPEDGILLEKRFRFAGLYRWTIRRVVRYTAAQADLLRDRSRWSAEKLKAWSRGQPMFYFPAWTDMDAFTTGNLAPQEPRPPQVLFAGRTSPIKGIHHLISAFSRVTAEFSDARLVVVGRPVRPDYADTLRGLVAALDLNGSVSFVGEVSQRDLAIYMHQSRVLVLPSLSEALPRVVFEAMACGTPVIGTRVGGIPEMIEEGVTGFLVDPGDEDTLTERLRWVLSHPEESGEMGRRARQAARKIFSTQAYLENYARLFETARCLLESQ